MNIINNFLKRNFFFLTFLICAILILYVGQVAADNQSKVLQVKSQDDDLTPSQISLPNSNIKVDDSQSDQNSDAGISTETTNTSATNQTDSDTTQTYYVEGETKASEKTNLVTLNIESSIARGVYQIEITDGVTTAYQVLEKASQEYGFTYEFKDYGGDLGKFITKIANIDTPLDYSFYWSLYYNGSPSMIGASNLVLHVGDTVSWRFIKAEW